MDEEEVARKKGLGKMSSTVVVFMRGASDVAGLLRCGLWMDGRWHSVRRFEAVQPVRKKTGWVWMREWIEKEGRERDERGRKAWLDMQDISEQLRVLRKSAEKVEDEEKRRKYEGFEEKRPVRPVAG